VTPLSCSAVQVGNLVWTDSVFRNYANNFQVLASSAADLEREPKMADTTPEIQSSATSQPSTQPPRVCFICDQPTKRCVSVSYSRTGAEVTDWRSFKVYFCERHAEVAREIPTWNLEELQQEIAARIGTGFVNGVFEEAPAVPYDDAGRVDTATAAIIEQTLQQEAATYAKLPDPNRVYAELLQNKVHSFSKAVKDAMAKDAAKSREAISESGNCLIPS
jgi:hypothetical protein